MEQLPGQLVGIDDFLAIKQDGFSSTLFNGLQVGQRFEFRSELDKRTLVMRVIEVTYDHNHKPILTIAQFERMYCRPRN